MEIYRQRRLAGIGTVRHVMGRHTARTQLAELVYVGYEQFFDEPDIEIIAGDGGGAGGLVTWYPVWNAMDGGYMMIPLGEGDLPLVLDFTYFDDAASLNIWGDSDSSDPSGDGWWLPPTDEPHGGRAGG